MTLRVLATISSKTWLGSSELVRARVASSSALSSRAYAFEASAWRVLLMASTAWSENTCKSCRRRSSKAATSSLETVSVPSSWSWSINGTQSIERMLELPSGLKRASRVTSETTTGSRCAATQPAMPSFARKRVRLGPSGPAPNAAQVTRSPLSESSSATETEGTASSSPALRTSCSSVVVRACASTPPRYSLMAAFLSALRSVPPDCILQ